MILDASAVLAVIFGESDYPEINAAMNRASALSMSAVNYLEAAIKIDGMGDPRLAAALEQLVAINGVAILPATPHHAELAREAYRRFGKGNHKARLNLGDCFAYALAKETGEPLLFKGDDFPQTDILAAL